MSLCITDLSQTWFYQQILQDLKFDSEEMAIPIARILGTSPSQSTKMSVTLGLAGSHATNKSAFHSQIKENSGQTKQKLKPLKWKTV